LFYFETTKGSGNDVKTIKHVVPFTMGYAVLPEEGGLMDQPYRMMEFFEIFMHAERQQQLTSLS
jgi:hypothetical protein